MRRLADQSFLHSSLLPAFTEACRDALERESFFGTANHYFDSKLLENELCPISLMSAFRTKAQKLWDNEKCTRRYPQNGSYRLLIMDDLMQCLEEAKEEVTNSCAQATLMETQKNRVFSAVKAHFGVEKKTLTDNLLKESKAILLDRYKEWIQHRILPSESILEKAQEDEATQELREELTARVGRLNECIALLHDVPLPVPVPSKKTIAAAERQHAANELFLRAKTRHVAKIPPNF